MTDTTPKPSRRWSYSLRELFALAAVLVGMCSFVAFTEFFVPKIIAAREAARRMPPINMPPPPGGAVMQWLPDTPTPP